MWTAVTFTAILLTVLYCLLIMLYNIWFVRLPYFRVDKNYSPKNTFSIVIPARDEEDVIEKCVLSVLQNDYPAELFEVIVVDDFSTDNTAAIVRHTSIQPVGQKGCPSLKPIRRTHAPCSHESGRTLRPHGIARTAPTALNQRPKQL